jgi:hypothetical protein
LDSAISIEHSPAILIATELIDRINILNNAVDDEIPSDLLISLVHHCNVSFLRSDFQLEIVKASIESCAPDIKSWSVFCRKSKLKKLVIEAFEELERHSSLDRIHTSERCIEILSLLLDYVNLVVFPNSDFGLMIQEKKSDDSQSSNGSISTRLVNGDDY